jgi:hypothetical protein
MPQMMRISFLSMNLYRTSVIARVISPKQSPHAARGLLRREDYPPRKNEITRIFGREIQGQFLFISLFIQQLNCWMFDGKS